MKGAELPRKALRRIAKSPEGAPQAIILAGSYGSGKTSSARIFARAVNCSERDGDSCGKCEMCLNIRDSSLLYNELDSAIVGNVEAMRSLRESFGYTLQKGYKVIVFDEIHLCGKAAQSTLLTVLEEAPKGVFFLFSTTNPEHILDTIISRSVVLEFDPIPDDQIRELISFVALNEQIEISDKAKDYVIRRVRGHARDALQQLEMVRLLGEHDYMAQGVFLESMFEEIIQLFGEGRNADAKEVIQKVVTNPVLFVEQDFEIFIRKISDGLFLDGKLTNKRLKDLVFFYLKNHRLLNDSNSWYLFLSAMASLFEVKQGTNQIASRFSK